MKFRSKASNKIMKVGYTIFFGLVIMLLFVIVVGTGENIFDDTYNIKIAVRQSEGLREGGAVLLGGLKIGNIKDIKFEPVQNKYKVIIELSLLQEYAAKITTSSRASIETFGLLGDKMINITLGNPGEEKLKNGEFMMVKETISFSSASTVIEPILKKIDSIATDLGIIISIVASGKSTIGKLLVSDSEINKLNKIIDNLYLISNSINSSNGSMGKFINEPELYDKLSAIISNLKVLSDSMLKGEGNIGKLLIDDSLYKNINDLTFGLNEIVKKVDNDSTLLGGTLTDKNLYIKINTLIDELRKLITDIKEHPDRYINVTVF